MSEIGELVVYASRITRTETVFNGEQCGFASAFTAKAERRLRG
jgi:hypothetical protein